MKNEQAPTARDLITRDAWRSRDLMFRSELLEELSFQKDEVSHDVHNLEALYPLFLKFDD